MTHTKEALLDQLKSEYFDLVAKAFEIQKAGDIKAYTINALQAERVAQKMQSVARQAQ